MRGEKHSEGCSEGAEWAGERTILKRTKDGTRRELVRAGADVDVMIAAIGALVGPRRFQLRAT